MSPSTPLALSLVEAQPQDLRCIEGLMQFYNHELSQWYPVEFGDAGLYAIRSKAEYWARPDVRPYLLRTPQVLPTGRNLHGFDPFRIPSAYALQDGAKQAQRLIDKHIAEGNPQIGRASCRERV